MMRNSYTQRRDKRRDTLAVATARNVAAYSRGPTYRVQLTLVSWFAFSIAILLSALRVFLERTSDYQSSVDCQLQQQ